MEVSMNDQTMLQQTPIPDVLLTKEQVGQILMALGNTVIYVKAQDGSMRPFIDPIPVQQILQQAINLALRTQGG